MITDLYDIFSINNHYTDWVWFEGPALWVCKLMLIHCIWSIKVTSFTHIRCSPLEANDFLWHLSQTCFHAPVHYTIWMICVWPTSLCLAHIIHVKHGHCVFEGDMYILTGLFCDLSVSICTLKLFLKWFSLLKELWFSCPVTSMELPNIQGFCILVRVLSEEKLLMDVSPVSLCTVCNCWYHEVLISDFSLPIVSVPDPL